MFIAVVLVLILVAILFPGLLRFLLLLGGLGLIYIIAHATAPSAPPADRPAIERR